MYKVFIEDKTINFVEKAPSTSENSSNIHLNVDNEGFVKSFLESNKTNKKSINLICEDVSRDFKKFVKNFKLILAGGGLVKNIEGKYLFIFRRGKWDLPKGKLDKNEKIEECALREVSEECGINQLQITKELISTYHIYTIKNEYVIKRTYWYEMLYKGNKNLVPQAQEDISKAEWIDKNEIGKLLPNSYESIKFLIENSI